MLQNVSLCSHSILRTSALDVVGKSWWMQSSMNGEVENQLVIYTQRKGLGLA